MFSVCYPPQVVVVSLLAPRMVFLFLPCPLAPKKCSPKCGIPVPSAMVADSGDLLAGTYCSLERLGRGEIQTASVQGTAQGLKLKAFVLTPKFLWAHRVLPADTSCGCCRRGKHQRSVGVIYLYSPSFPALRGTFFLLRMDSFACCMLSYSFDISLGGENSRIS